MIFPRKLIDSAKEWLPDSLFLSMTHYRRIGRFPNLRSPRTYSEKILLRCLYPDPRYVNLTDKLTVRSYVASKVGEDHLIPLIAEPDVFTREVFDALPSAFVMKANHGSGFVQVVRDKSKTSYETLLKQSRQWLSTDFYRIARERHYHLIKPRIYFETLLLDETGEVPADLKFHVFNERSGKQTIFIAVISDRFKGIPRGDMYDADWNLTNISFGAYKRSPVPGPRPHNLDKLLSVASALASDFDYVRVDLYTSMDSIYFGELTFTPGAGVMPMSPANVDFDWGRLLENEPTPRASGVLRDRAT
jgi:hypothetical protein